MTPDWRDRLLTRLGKLPARKPRAPLNAQRDEEIWTLCKEGWELEKVAKRYGLGRERIKQIARKAYTLEHGYPPSSPSSPKWERNAEIYRRFMAGEKKAELARAFNVSATTITGLIWRAEHPRAVRQS